MRAEDLFMQQLMSYFSEDEWIDILTASKITGQSEATVKKHFRKLAARGLVIVSGPNRNCRYLPIAGGCNTDGIYESYWF